MSEQAKIVRRRKFHAKPIAAGHSMATAGSFAMSKEHATPKSPQSAITAEQGPTVEKPIHPPFSPSSSNRQLGSIAMAGSPLIGTEIARSRLLSSTESIAMTKKQKRVSKIDDDEKLDAKKHTLADLATWQPKTENTLRKKWNEKREQVSEDQLANEGGDGSTSISGDNTPRVVMNEEGEMTVEEGSVSAKFENVWESADPGHVPKKLTSMSFRKFKRPTTWTILETDLFYEILAATGTDFALMHDYIPIRSRAELKRKFTKEQRDDSSRIDEVLQNPCMLDNTLQDRADRLLKQIEKEQEEKKEKKRPKKRKANKAADATDDGTEATDDDDDRTQDDDDEDEV